MKGHCLLLNRATFLLLFLFMLAGFDSQDSDPDQEPQMNPWHTTFTFFNRGIYPENVPKSVIESGNNLILSGVLSRDIFNQRNRLQLYKSGVGPVLQYFQYGGDAGLPPGVFSNLAHDLTPPFEIIDLSNLVVFYPNQSQALAVIISNSTKTYPDEDGESILSNYYLFYLDESLNPSIYNAIITVIYKNGAIESIYFSMPNLQTQSMFFYGFYEATETKIYQYRFREHIDFTGYDKGKVSIYRAPVHAEEVLPSYLEDSNLRLQLLNFANKIAGPVGATKIKSCHNFLL